MAWNAPGVLATLDWHVQTEGWWRVEPLPVGDIPVTGTARDGRRTLATYRHQATECAGRCTQPCGHTLAYGCDCDTLAAEADNQD
jgi:hypothetical protein